MELKIIHLITIIHVSYGLNVAFKKPTSQSSTYLVAVSAKAVDSDHNTCIHTDIKIPHSTDIIDWWLVDLLGYYGIDEIRILNSPFYPYRLSKFTISVWNFDPGPYLNTSILSAPCTCLYYPVAVKHPKQGFDHLTCSKPCAGRFVTVTKLYMSPGTMGSDVLAFCELQVLGSLVSSQLPCEITGVYLSGLKMKNMKAVVAADVRSDVIGVLHILQCLSVCLQHELCLSFNLNDAGICQIINSSVHPMQQTVYDSQSTWTVLTDLSSDITIG